MDQNNGLEAKISKEGTRITKMIDLQEFFPNLMRILLQSQFSHLRITIRTMEDHMINAKTIHSVEAMEIDYEMDLPKLRMGTAETMGTCLVLQRLRGETNHKKTSYRQSRSDQLNNSLFRRADNQPTKWFTPYEQNFPQNNNQTCSNAVRFTTTDDTIIDLSDPCPINY